MWYLIFFYLFAYTFFSGISAENFNLSTISALREWNNAVINLRFLEPPVQAITRLQGIEEVVLGPLHACTENGLVRNPFTNQFFVPPRLPPELCTNEQKNIAIYYALLRLTLSIQSQDPQLILDSFVFLTNGLDPFDESLDLSTPVGVGNFFGFMFAKFAENDGTNQLGILRCNKKFPSFPIELQFNGLNYSDYTCYRPVNDFDKIRVLDRWAPLLVHADTVVDAKKLVEIQTFTFPGWASKNDFAAIDKKAFIDSIPPPIPAFKDHYCKNAAHDSDLMESCLVDASIDPKKKLNPKFLAQVEEVIEASAALNDTSKSLIEVFENQNNGVVIPFRTLFVELGIPNPGPVINGTGPLDPNDPQSINGQAKLLISFGVTVESAGILMEGAKLKYDYARPITVIRELFKNKFIKAWGGPFQGTVTLKGAEFASYVPTRPWAEHPSFVCCESAASAIFVDLIRGNGTEGTGGLPFQVTVPAGSSRIEPGVVPAEPVTFVWNTTQQYIDAACESRVLAGVSFRAGVEAVKETCKDIGRKSFWRWVKINNGEPLIYEDPFP
jgi:hypothetical protein